MAQEYERAVVFRLGRIIDGGHKGPGIFFVYKKKKIKKRIFLLLNILLFQVFHALIHT